MLDNDSLTQGLTEALAYAQGKDVGARVHYVELPNVDIASVRARTGLSQGGDIERAKTMAQEIKAQEIG